MGVRGYDYYILKMKQEPRYILVYSTREGWDKPKSLIERATEYVNQETYFKLKLATAMAKIEENEK